MMEHQDVDSRIRDAFDAARRSEEKQEVFILQSFYDQKALERIAKEKKEGRIIVTMAAMAVLLFNHSMALLLGGMAALPYWVVNLLTVALSIVSLSVIILFYGLNKLGINHKEVIT